MIKVSELFKLKVSYLAMQAVDYERVRLLTAGVVHLIFEAGHTTLYNEIIHKLTYNKKEFKLNYFGKSLILSIEFDNSYFSLGPSRLGTYTKSVIIADDLQGNVDRMVLYTLVVPGPDGVSIESGGILSEMLWYSAYLRFWAITEKR